MARVLKTRMVGYAPDLRHPLAPPEVVYEIEKPSLRRQLRQLCLRISLFDVGAVLLVLGGVALAWLP